MRARRESRGRAGCGLLWRSTSWQKWQGGSDERAPAEWPKTQYGSSSASGPRASARASASASRHPCAGRRRTGGVKQHHRGASDRCTMRSKRSIRDRRRAILGSLPRELIPGSSIGRTCGGRARDVSHQAACSSGVKHAPRRQTMAAAACPPPRPSPAARLDPALAELLAGPELPVERARAGPGLRAGGRARRAVTPSLADDDGICMRLALRPAAAVPHCPQRSAARPKRSFRQCL